MADQGKKAEGLLFSPSAFSFKKSNPSAGCTRRSEKLCKPLLRLTLKRFQVSLKDRKLPFKKEKKVKKR